MSSSESKRDKLLGEIAVAMRRTSGLGVLHSQAMAERLGINSTDLECLDLVVLGEASTAGELAQRRYGAAVRLEVSAECPPDLDSFLMRQFALSAVDFYEASGPVNLNRLEAISMVAYEAPRFNLSNQIRGHGHMSEDNVAAEQLRLFIERIERSLHLRT